MKHANAHVCLSLHSHCLNIFKIITMGPRKGCFSNIIVFSNIVKDRTSDIPYLNLFDVNIAINIHIICILYVLQSNSFSFPFLSSSYQTLCYLILSILVSISFVTSSSFLFPCGILSVLSLSFDFSLHPLPYPRTFLKGGIVRLSLSLIQFGLAI